MSPAPARVGPVCSAKSACRALLHQKMPTNPRLRGWAPVSEGRLARTFSGIRVSNWTLLVNHSRGNG